MRLEKLLLCVLPLAFTLPAVADTVTVNGTTSIWLAGQPSGTTTSGYFSPPPDTAPNQSPANIAVSGLGSYVTFSASGSVSVDSSCYAGPAGGCYSSEGGDSPSPWSTYYNGPAGTLVGIFTDGTAPTIETENGGTGPILVTGSSNSSPVLDQIFIVGTGGTFLIPVGATEVYLAPADALGASSNDAGSYGVDYSFTNTAPTVTPEPGSLALLGTGALSLFGMVRRRRA